MAPIIPPNQKSSIGILYGDFQGDGANLGKIDVSISGAEQLGLTPSNARLGIGDTLEGTGGNYTITTNSASDDFSGTGLFILTMPNVSSTTIYDVSVTARAYDKDNGLLATQSLSIKYIVAVKSTTCDNNYNVSVSTSAGVPEKVSDFLGTNYAISTDSATIDISLTPESNSTEIYYDSACSFGTGQTSKQNGINGLNLNYGNENSACFIIQTECYRQWMSMASTFNENGAIIIGGIDWYENLAYNIDLINISITRNDNRSRTNTLKSLSISDVAIDFKPDLKTYIGTVPYKVSSIRITSSLTDSKSSYVSGYGNRTVSLNEGSNDVLIKVRAENGEEATYTIKITREKNDDATLKSLKIDDKEIKLQKDILLYKEYVNNDVTKVEIKAEATDSNAKVEIGEIKELKEGINKVNITVTASNGKKNIYVLNVIRDKLISENSKLKNIIIANHKLDFNSGVYEYVVDVDKNEDKLDITVETEHPKAKFLIIGNKGLKNNSIVKIKVTAEDGKTITMYELKINKKSGFNILLLIIPIVILAVSFAIFKLIKKDKNKLVTSAPDIVDDTAIKNEESQVNSVQPSNEVNSVPTVDGVNKYW